MFKKMTHKKNPGEQFFAHLIWRCFKKNECQISHLLQYRGDQYKIFHLKILTFFLVEGNSTDDPLNPLINALPSPRDIKFKFLN